MSFIVVLSLGLHLLDYQAIKYGNDYYTATVKSMLQSWHNFFFLAAEPGGSVAVDKPPLGFWIETAFASVLGVTGLAVSLPNILAGVLSVLLLYHLVKKYFGIGPGLAAALAFVFTPVSLAVDRTNNVDGMLVLTLLLAAWAFLDATETGRLRYLLAGAALVGLGFNIKAVQAFIPLPALYALYFLGAKLGWRQKILHLGLASILLAAISLTWPVIVDRVPAEQRPYIGSSQHDSELEIIFGYNGVNRLLRKSNPQPPATNQGAPPGQLGVGTVHVGHPGVTRFFQPPLAKEMSWLLPFGLVALGLAAFSGRIHLPLRSSEHKALVLWGGWLVTGLVLFSITGFFHNYYLATIAPALGALVGVGFYRLNRLALHGFPLAGGLLLAMTAITLAFQWWLVSQFGMKPQWVWLSVVLAGMAGIIVLAFFIWQRNRPLLFGATELMSLAALLFIPAVWSAYTVMFDYAAMVPAAFIGEKFTNQDNTATPTPAGLVGENVDPAMLAFLQEHTQDTRYLVAVPSSRLGSKLILATGRPVLMMGGFSGADPVVDRGSLSRLVGAGELRFIQYGEATRPDGGGGANREIANWLKAHCQVVPQFTQAQQSQELPGPGDRIVGTTLYQCAKQ